MVEKNLDLAKGILYVTSVGDIHLSSMLRGVEFIENAKELPKRIKILENATSARVVFDHSEIQLIIDRLKDVLVRFDSYRHAVVLTDPTNTAFTMLASMMIHHPNYSLEVFSTRQAAEGWLELFD